MKKLDDVGNKKGKNIFLASFTDNGANYFSKNVHNALAGKILSFFSSPARWIRPKIGSFDRPCLKETSWRVFRKICQSPKDE
jgi:hypothetical protein